MLTFIFQYFLCANTFMWERYISPPRCFLWDKWKFTALETFFVPLQCEKSVRPPSQCRRRKRARISSRGTFCEGRLSDQPQKRIFPPWMRAARGQFCASELCARKGGRARFVQRVWLRWQLLPPSQLRSRWPPSLPLHLHSVGLARWRKGCNSLLARNGSGGGRGDYSPRSRFADDDKRESADPIAG